VIDRLSITGGLNHGLSRMKGNFHVRFLGEGEAVTLRPYPTISPLPPVLLEPLQTAGSLCSTDITPLPRYYRPGRIPLAFHRLPGVTGYTASLLRRFLDGTRRVSPVA
jgi:hypothetical protein